MKIKNKMKANTLMKWLTIAFFAMVIFNLGNNYLKKSNSESMAGFSEMLKKSNAMDSIRQNISNLQRDLPQKFTNGNSLDEIKFDEKSKQVVYSFTYENLDSSSEAEISNFENKLNQEAIVFWKDLESKYAFIDSDVSIKYLVFDKNKKEVFNFIITPQDMK